MDSKKPGFTSIDAYIAMFPEATQKILQELRATIKAAAPDAKEVISYQMPAFKLKGNLVYFAAWKNHIGFYPASGGVPQAFKDELAQFDGTSGSIHFPMDKPLPLDLVREIVKYRVIEDLQHAEEKAKARKLKKGEKR
jgi:uncharacterized protein YdhG (YjbR/CyaY superfamily)